MTLFVYTASNGDKILYIHKKFRDKNGKSTTKVVEKLGTYSDLAKVHEDPIAWGRERARELTEQENESARKVMIAYSPTKRINKDEQRLLDGGYLFLQKIYHELGIHKICNKISKDYRFEYDLDAILSRLIYGRILAPSSKCSTMEYSKKLLEAPKFELHDIYRALEVLAKENDSIQSSLYKNSCALSKRNDKILYYDVTNYYFEMEEADGLKQYGFSKEHRPNPIVSMGLFMDADGIPLAFCINPGNTNEQLTLKPLEKKIISDFEHSEFIVCTDAGLSSYENRKFNSIMNRGFITVQSVKSMKTLQKEWALSEEGWHLPGSKKIYTLSEIKSNPDMYKENTFYKEDYINENGLEQRFIVTFSLKYANYLKRLREQHLERANKAIANKTTDTKRATDYKRFIRNTSYTDDGTVAENTASSIDQERVDEEAKYDGFYAVATSLTDSVEEIIKANGRRWEIEECFEIMKSEFKARPVYLSKDERIEAHFLTCYLALTVYRYLEKRLDYRYTCSEIIHNLRDIKFHFIPGEGYVPMYERTDFTDNLHEAFGFRTDYEIIPTPSMKKIFAATKKG